MIYQLKKFTLFIGCEFICFSLLTLFHITLLKEDLLIMASYEENYQNIPYLTVSALVLLGISLILFACYLNGNIRKLAPSIVISIIALVIIYKSFTEFEYYLDTYLTYLIILIFLWGVVFWIHGKIESSMAKGEQNISK